MGARVSHEEIRHMVRELLRDAVAGRGDPPPAGQAPATPAMAARSAGLGGLSERVRAALASGGGGAGIEIVIASDSDLNAFAQQVALCALERDLLGAIASNRVRFRLAGADAPAAEAAQMRAAAGAPAAVTDGDAYHWERGLLSETKITEIARSHGRLVLGRQALLTPLAWDRVRSLGLQVVRMRP